MLLRVITTADGSKYKHANRKLCNSYNSLKHADMRTCGHAKRGIYNNIK